MSLFFGLAKKPAGGISWVGFSRRRNRAARTTSLSRRYRAPGVGAVCAHSMAVCARMWRPPLVGLLGLRGGRLLATATGMPGSFGGLNSLAGRALSPARGIGAGIGGFLS